MALSNIEVAAAHVTIYAKLDKDFDSTVTGGLGRVSTSALTVANAVGTVIGNIFSRLGSSISAVTGDAIARLDTMQNFPIVMQNLGYSSEDATSAISTMSDSLTGLPTALNDMVSVVQRLAPLTGDISSATEVGLALNDALLASGASTSDVSRAMLQYSQMLAKGKVDMQSWNTLTETMSGQLDQVAKSLLGPEANATALYEALQSGTLTFDDFNEALVELDRNGYDGLASFRDQAFAATGGIETALANVRTAMTRAVAGILDAIGRENITTVISGITTLIGAAGKVIADVITGIRESGFGEVLGNIVTAFSEWATGAGNLATALHDTGGIIDGIAGAYERLQEFLRPAMETAAEYAPLVQGAWDEMKTAVGEAWETIQPAIEDLKTALEDLGLDFSEEGLPWLVKNAMESIANDIRVLTPIIEGIVRFIGIIAESTAIQIEFWRGVLDVIQAKFEEVKTALEPLRQAFSDAFGFISDLISAFVDAANGDGSALQAYWSALPSNILAFFQNLASLFSEPFRNVYTTVTGWGQKILDWFAGLPGRIVDSFRNLGQKIIAAIGSIRPTFDFTSVDVAGVPISVPTISWATFARGGIVDSPTFGIFGEAGAEANIPLSGSAMYPFADAIAERIGNGGNVYNVSFDGVAVNDDPAIRDAFINLMYALNARAVM